MSTTHLSDFSDALTKLTAATETLRRSGGEVPATIERLVGELDLDLHADAPRRDVDPYLSTALYAAALRSMKALRQDNGRTRYSDLRVALEDVRNALQDIVDTGPFGDDESASQIAARLVASVQAPQPALAAVLGVSTRQLQRWLSGNPAPTRENAARLRIVARLVNQLRHSFTAPGVIRWFEREHPRLGVEPMALLDDPLHYPELEAVARGSRTTVA